MQHRKKTTRRAREAAMSHEALDPAAAPPGERNAEPVPEADPRRFMTARDFLDRRDAPRQDGPATWGWRGAVRRWSGGLVEPRMGRHELAHEQDRHAIQG